MTALPTLTIYAAAALARDRELFHHCGASAASLGPGVASLIAFGRFLAQIDSEASASWRRSSGRGWPSDPIART